ncbi:MAG: heavy-metal-associated domain-containing protein [Gemmatimonadaceae bacterium]
MERLTLNISGMTCGHCVGRVTTALKSVDGVKVENVNVGSATVSYDPAATSPTKITDAVENVGYEAALAGQAP